MEDAGLITITIAKKYKHYFLIMAVYKIKILLDTNNIIDAKYSDLICKYIKNDKLIFFPG